MKIKKIRPYTKKAEQRVDVFKLVYTGKMDLGHRYKTCSWSIIWPCRPCSKKEKELIYGGYNAVGGNGGIAVRVGPPGFFQPGNTVSGPSETAL